MGLGTSSIALYTLYNTNLTLSTSFFQCFFNFFLPKSALQQGLQLLLRPLDGIVHSLQALAHSLSDLAVAAPPQILDPDRQFHVAEDLLFPGNIIQRFLDQKNGLRIGTAVGKQGFRQSLRLLIGKGLIERYGIVQGLMLLTGGLLDRRNDLAIDAKLRKGAESGLAAAIETFNGTKNPDHAFLYNIVMIGAYDKVQVSSVLYRFFVFADTVMYTSIRTVVRYGTAAVKSEGTPTDCNLRPNACKKPNSNAAPNTLGGLAIPNTTHANAIKPRLALMPSVKQFK